jgi:hypothetical protein
MVEPGDVPDRRVSSDMDEGTPVAAGAERLRDELASNPGPADHAECVLVVFR